MTQLEIAQILREQIKQEWPFVSTILALYENNTEGQFSERIQAMVNKLLPDEVYYDSFRTELINNKSTLDFIKSLPIQVVLFATEDNPLGILK